jgi:hypothetical protein
VPHFRIVVHARTTLADAIADIAAPEFALGRAGRHSRAAPPSAAGRLRSVDAGATEETIDRRVFRARSKAASLCQCPPLAREGFWGQNPGGNLTAIDLEALSAHGYEAIGLVGKLIGQTCLFVIAISGSQRCLTARGF